MTSPIRIYNKDSKDMIEVEENSVQLILTSPSYNIATPYKDYADTLNMSEYKEMLEQVFQQCYKKLKPGGVLAVNIPEFIKRKGIIYFTPKIFLELLTACGFTLTETIFWAKATEKGRFFCSKKWKKDFSTKASNLHSVTEWILILNKKPVKKKLSGEVWFIKPEKSKLHPAVWPQKLPARIIQRYSTKSNTVLDPFMGIGTTGLMCKKLKRNC